MTALCTLFDAGQRQRLFSNIAEAMGACRRKSSIGSSGHFTKVHPDYGAGVRYAIKVLSRAQVLPVESILAKSCDL